MGRQVAGEIDGSAIEKLAAATLVVAMEETPRTSKTRASKSSAAGKVGVRAQPLIAVRDVRASRRWYAQLLGRRGHGDCF
jgi:hypothetical protein